jgi:hypothetical protein
MWNRRPSNMGGKQVEFLVKLRDAFTMTDEATNEYLQSLAPPGIQEKQDLPGSENLKEG